MAWPASKATIGDRFEEINRIAGQMRYYVTNVVNDSNAGPVNRKALIGLQHALNEMVVQLDAAVVLPAGDVTALIAFARDQFNDAALDPVAEFAAMRSAAVVLRDWIYTNFPRDAGSGAVLADTVTQAGVLTPLTFSPEQLAGFRTQAAAFLATIS